MEDDYRQHLESCLHLEQEHQSQDVETIKEMINDFQDEVAEVISESKSLKFLITNKAKKRHDKAINEVLNNRIKANKQLKNIVIRATGGIFLLYLTFNLLSGVKAAVDNQFCQFYNVQGRTQRYETQKPCER